MPELPEAERARQEIEKALGREIEAVDDSDGYVCRPHGPGELAAAFGGRRLTSAHRRGKFLWVETDDGDGPVLGLHLGMAGRIVIDDEPAPEIESHPPRFTLEFADGSRLALFDRRRFSRAVLEPDYSHVGPDAGEIGAKAFADRVGRGTVALKARLLDQGVVAGVGNLLADEVLWRARLSPRRQAGELTRAELNRLHRHLRAAIADAIRLGGAHTGDFVPHRRRGGACPRCGAPVERATIGGRTTFWCPSEQPEALVDGQTTGLRPRPVPSALKQARRTAEIKRNVPSHPLRHILRKTLLATTVYVGLLVPMGALAQDPTPRSATPPAVETVVATVTAEPAVEAPAATATSSPESTSTPEPTSTPSVEPTAVATPAALPSPTPTPDGGDPTEGELTVDFSRQVGGKRGRQDSESRTIEGCVEARTRKQDRRRGKRSTSTSARDCPVEASSRKKKVIEKDRPVPPVAPDGTPTISNPTLSLANPGAAPIGVPNFFIDKFRIPPFLLPIYQAAGTEYGIRWEILAAINEIETDYGRNLNVSSAGALGWMQFMPPTWKMYGVDANKDGTKDPFNPVDAIFAAARYLKAAGADTDVRRGIFAYNHADWYVDSVLLRARTIGGLPANFVGSLTGLTQARFPVDAKARYAGAVRPGKGRRVAKGANAAMPVESDAARRNIDIFAKAGSPAIAVNDGRVVALGRNAERGRYVRLQDVYGNTYTYSHLGRIASTYPAPRDRLVSKTRIARELELPKTDPKPTVAASSTRRRAAAKRHRKAPAKSRKAPHRPRPSAPKPAPTPAATLSKDRLFAHPARPRASASGGDLQLAQNEYRPSTGAALKLNPRDFVAKRMRKGARVIAGTFLGSIGRTSKTVAPHLRFEIRPAGRGAPRIDPKPILDGWKLLESTEIYRAAGRNPFVGPDAKQPSIGQILLMSKEALQQHVLANPRIDVYACGRRDIRLGLVDRRVLSALEFLAASGLKPAVSSLQCGHGYLTASGNVSAHSSGNAVDVAAVNGIPILGNQGGGSVTELTIQRLLTLQGTMKPHQIISLMTFEGADNTMAMADHADHIHLGFQPLYSGNGPAARRANAVLRPRQWIKLIDRLDEIDNPVVATTPSKFALEVAGD